MASQAAKYIIKRQQKNTKAVDYLESDSFRHGGPEEDRTLDLHIVNTVLSNPVAN